MPRLVLVLFALLAGTDGASGGRDDMQPELNMRAAPACYTLLHNSGTIGCRSPRPGSWPVPIAIVDAQSELDAFARPPGARSAVNPASAVLLAAPLLTSVNLAALQQSGRCAGVILADSVNPPPHGFSPAEPMPYCKCGALPPCTDRWNPAGNGLEQRSFDFPMISITEAEEATLRSQIARGSSDPQAFPRYQVQMNLYMDAFDGYALEGGQWWEMQLGTRCCPSCRPNCGAACCSAEFKCVSASTKDANVSWATPKCARRQGPTSLSCIPRGSCLPIGGYNIWSLNSIALPGANPPPPTARTPPGSAPPPQRIVMVTANLDSSSLFHDMAPGASADGSAVVALIAAADALRPLRADMASRGGASIMFTLLQAENWDHVGSRRLFHDMDAFRCRKRKGPGDGVPHDVCLDPPMLAPDIEHVNSSMVDFVLHVEQLLPSDAPTLYLHTGCHPSAHTQAMEQLLLSHGGAPAGAAAIAAASPGLPMPASCFLSSIFEGDASAAASSARPPSGTGSSGVRSPPAPRGMGVLAGYDAAFKTPLYHSRFDRGGAGVDLPRLCAAAARLSMVLYTLATGLEPPAISVDSGLVSKLAARLMGVPLTDGRDEGQGAGRRGSEPFKTAYSSVYLPPTQRGPSEREAYVHEQLSLANALSPQAAGAGGAGGAPPVCDCCNDASKCTPAPFTQCVAGKCVTSLTFFHDAYPVGIEFSLDKNAFILSNGTDIDSLRSLCVQFSPPSFPTSFPLPVLPLPTIQPPPLPHPPAPFRLNQNCRVLSRSGVLSLIWPVSSGLVALCLQPALTPVRLHWHNL